MVLAYCSRGGCCRSRNSDRATEDVPHMRGYFTATPTKNSTWLFVSLTTAAHHEPLNTVWSRHVGTSGNPRVCEPSLFLVNQFRGNTRKVATTNHMQHSCVSPFPLSDCTSFSIGEAFRQGPQQTLQGQTGISKQIIASLLEQLSSPALRMERTIRSPFTESKTSRL